MPKAQSPIPKKINLALQGGGAHGAYTWGVLDRLLEEESLVIEGISGTSAGAINGALLAGGMAKGGREGAKAFLEEFWRRVGTVSAFGSMPSMPGGDKWDLDYAPGYRWFDVMSRVFSPYMFNPLNVNPMRDILEDMLLPKLMKKSPIALYATATHVESGQAHVFEREEVTTDVLLASSCIPFLFQAVEVGGEHYWDGGYMGNPAIWPLIYHCKSKDVVLVQINPIHRDGLPQTADEIVNRLNEITFNSSLVAEMRAIDFVARLIKEKRLSKSRYKDMRMHLIYAREAMHKLDASSKMNTDWDFFLFLKNIGRETAENWLKTDWTHVGKKSTVNIREKFLLGPHKKPKGVLKKRTGKNK